jgi:hypothetical protein
MPYRTSQAPKHPPSNQKNSFSNRFNTRDSPAKLFLNNAKKDQRSRRMNTPASMYVPKFPFSATAGSGHVF